MNFFFYGIPAVLPTLGELIDERVSSSVAFVIACVLGCVFLPYLLGSINPAILISTKIYHKDIRTFGSGNAGSTNMLRTFGKGPAAATFLLDLAKAGISVLLGAFLFGFQGAALAGFFVMFGHMFPLYYRFKGGKGVACLAMVVLLESPVTLLILLAFFILMVFASRMVSFGSVFSAILYPLILRAFTKDIPLYVAMAILSAIFVVFMHRANIKRIMQGKESKLSFSKKDKEEKKKEETDG
ncbi:MAG: glycerol-3-phosphate 1-O-acyltransferase PlsY [Clostridia bacterium]|nr:glycerol-3-phosphate 1-O-acyltransferase PlsY [Clostridia bacterium]